MAEAPRLTPPGAPPPLSPPPPLKPPASASAPPAERVITSKESPPNVVTSAPGEATGSVSNPKGVIPAESAPGVALSDGELSARDNPTIEASAMIRQPGGIEPNVKIEGPKGSEANPSGPPIKAPRPEGVLSPDAPIGADRDNPRPLGARKPVMTDLGINRENQRRLDSYPSTIITIGAPAEVVIGETNPRKAGQPEPKGGSEKHWLVIFNGDESVAINCGFDENRARRIRDIANGG